MEAMLPPPAPIVSMSTVWVRKGCRPTDTSDLNNGRPGITAMSQLVPPVSREINCSIPFTSPGGGASGAAGYRSRDDGRDRCPGEQRGTGGAAVGLHH